MSILADSNVVVAAVAAVHPDHEACKHWLEQAAGRTELVLATHGLAEAYNTLTKPRGLFGMRPTEARAVIGQLRRQLRIVSLSGADYAEAFERAVELDVRGAQVYDLLHTVAARKAGARRIATMNTKHFVNLWPPSQLINPAGNA